MLLVLRWIGVDAGLVWVKGAVPSDGQDGRFRSLIGPHEIVGRCTGCMNAPIADRAPWRLRRGVGFLKKLEIDVLERDVSTGLRPSSQSSFARSLDATMASENLTVTVPSKGTMPRAVGKCAELTGEVCILALLVCVFMETSLSHGSSAQAANWPF